MNSSTLRQTPPSIFQDSDLTLDGACKLDKLDPLAGFRDQFHLPQKASGGDVVYLTGNSLGLQPKSTRDLVLEVLDDWQKYGVEGHFKPQHAWMPYHQLLTAQMAELVGARQSEVVVMNSLTVNLHLLMASFYRPTPSRRKIVIEHHAFPSDRYAVRSQIEWHGFNPKEDLIIVGASDDKDILDEQDIEAVLRAEGDSVALVLIGGVNYYSGQLFDMARIVRAARTTGAVVGFDLAHAAGNVPLQLHDWNVDFAAWCSYKYLNAGPGGPSGVFVHERHCASGHVPRLSGWWGHNAANRFEMPDAFEASPGAEGWQLSNPSILSMAALKASLDVFSSAGREALVAKSTRLTAYTEALLDLECKDSVQIITPRDPSRRGAQLSIRINPDAILDKTTQPDGESFGKQVFKYLEESGVLCDWREPDVIRLAPVPLYNSFEDAYRFVQILKKALGNS